MMRTVITCPRGIMTVIEAMIEMDMWCLHFPLSPITPSITPVMVAMMAILKLSKRGHEHSKE